MSENQASGEASQLEELALRLLIYPGDWRTRQPRLFLGKIPRIRAKNSLVDGTAQRRAVPSASCYACTNSRRP